MYPTTKNIVFGVGDIFFDMLNESTGEYDGELYLAETPGFTLKIATETVEDWSSDSLVAEKLVDIQTKITRDFELNTKNIVASALAMFIQATLESLTTSAGSVTGKAINGGVGVKQGYWYQLGVDSTHPAGVRGVASVAIKDSVPTTYTVTTDYILDADLARIYIVPGGTIVDGTVITSDYDTTAVSWEQLASNDLGPARGRLRYVARNLSGTHRDMFAPDVVMKPNGDFAVKGERQNAQVLGFSVGVQTPGDGRAALYVNGRAAA